MSSRSKLVVTLVLIALLIGLGVADYYYSGEQYTASVPSNEAQSSSSQASIPAGAVAKNKGPDVPATITDLQLSAEPSEDLSLLQQVAVGDTSLQSLTVLSSNDRAGSVTWIESPDVKNIFIALKEALLTAFSSEVADLQDTTVQEAGKPVRNLLTFFDPALSEERLTFVRVRERLYEFHIATGKEAVMNPLIEALTAR